jgi:hypothetical protein
MDTIVRTPARMEFRRTFVVDNQRRNRVYALFEERTDRAIGIRLDWFPHGYASAPLHYITTDNGETFRRVTNYLMFIGNGGVDDRIGEEETLPKTVAALRGLLSTWRDTLAKERLD